MKNNKILLGICAILIFIIGEFIWWNASSSKTKNSPTDVLIESPNTIPPSIMVDGEIYSSTGRESPIEPDESEIKNVTSVIKGIELPSKEGEINFPAPDAKYAKINDYEQYVVVLMDLEWVRFEIYVFNLEQFAGYSSNLSEYYFEPNVSIIEGTLITRLHYGPPNFGEDPENDDEEYPFILLLDDPISVIAKETDTINSNISDVSEIQLVLRGNPYVDMAKEYKNKHIKVQGTLFSAFTGHHHTKVLMVVDEVLE